MATLTVEISGTFDPTICAGIGNVISSLESVFGRTRCEWRDGLTIAPFGPDRALASRSVPRENVSARPTNGIYGRNSPVSSATAALQRSLANRLQAAMDVNGSPEYALTWKEWPMKSGPPICALRASARRISDKGSIGWPTPCARDGKDRRTKRPPRGGCGRSLGQAVLYARAQTEPDAGLNPELSSWLMGIPPEILNCAPSATRSSRKSRRNSSPPISIAADARLPG